MIKKQHIALIGFTGAGKSTVARILSKRYGVALRDTDELVEVQCKASVPELFRTRGEKFFRECEHDCLVRALDTPEHCVIACGGGIVTRPENTALLKEKSFVVYLHLKAEHALSRIDDMSSRPLLEHAGTVEAVAALLASRTALYEVLADISVATDYRDSDEVADTLVERVREADYGYILE